MKFKKAVSCILVAVLTAGMLGGAFSASAEGEKKDNTLKFGEDGKFTVLHITDIQDRYPINSVAKRYIIDTLEKVKPDLVILGGDNIAGNVMSAKWRITKAIDEYMSIFEERGIKVAAVFGNHDAENKSTTKQYQQSVYESYSCYVGTTGYTDTERVGNYNLPILSSDGSRYAFNLWLIDSGDYNTENDLEGYAAVKEGQIEWYKQQCRALAEENGGKAVPSLSFQHIIVPEIFDALKEVEKGTEGAVEKQHAATKETKYYVLPETAKGELNEVPCPPEYTNGQFEAMIEMGDVLAVVSGHDHTNTFEIKYKGIDIINTPCMSFSTASYNGTNMGSRVFVLDENDPENYETYVIGYDSIYSRDDVVMRSGFEAYTQSNSIIERIYYWFVYNLSRHSVLFKKLFEKCGF